MSSGVAHSNNDETLSKRIRVVSSQVLASSSSMFLFILIGCSILLPAIVIPQEINGQGQFSMSKEEVSWFGGLQFLMQPVGAIFCGPTSNYFGRQRALLLSNLFQIIGWALFYYCWDVPTLFAANAILGIGFGFMEAPALTYITEISEPKLRGSLISAAFLISALAGLSICALATIMNWKTIALIFLAISVISSLTTFFIPETPYWLLSKGKEDKALESLQSVRGWCPKNTVHEELQDLLDYNKMKNECEACTEIHFNVACAHKNQSMMKKLYFKLKYTIFVKETLRPMLFIFIYQLTYTFSGFMQTKMNVVNIANALGLTISGEFVLLVSGFIYIPLNLLYAITARLVGKRKVALIAMTGIFVSSFCLAVYAMVHLAEVSSYDKMTFPVEKSLFSTIMFLMMLAFIGFVVPTVMFSEVFPFKSRGTVTGIVLAIGNILIFLSIKLNVNIETHFKIAGTFFFDSAFACVGLVYLYMYMPETENKTLAEIEEHFSGNDRVVGSLARICLKRDKKNTRDIEQLEKVLGSENDL